MTDAMMTIPIAVPNIGPEDMAAVQATMADGWVSTVGPAVSRFEAAVAAEAGVERAVAVAAGTMGLHVALVALGVGRDDLVLCPSFSFIATANAISQAGAEPYFVDIDPETWSLSPVRLAEILAEDCARDRTGALRHVATGRRVAAVMPVYTMGAPADMDAISAVAAEYGLPIVADAAAAIGAKYKGRPLGGLADLSVYSFNGNKTITTGGGGAVFGADTALVDLVKHLSSTARVPSGEYDHDRAGFNYRMTALEAALGCAQIARLADFLAAKRRIRERYAAAFANSGLSPFPEPDFAESAFWFSGGVLPEGAGIGIEEACAALRAAGVGVRVFWKPLHGQPPYRNALRGPLPATEAIWPRVLVLPCSTHISDEELARVEGAVRTHVIARL